MTSTANLTPATRMKFWALAIFVGLLPIMPLPAAAAIILLSMTSFSFRTVHSHWPFLLLLIQYFIIQLVLNLYHDGDIWTARLNDAYLILVFASVIMLPIMLEAAKHLTIWHTGLLIGLWGSAFVIAADYYGVIGGRGACRAYGMGANPLLPAFLWVVLVPFVFFQWSKFTTTRKCQTIAAYGLVGIAVFCFTGSRMATYAWIMAIPAIAGFIWVQSRSFRDLLLLTAGLVLTFITAIGIDTASGCMNALRFGNTINSINFISANFDNLNSYFGHTAAKIIDDGMPSSEGIRLMLWAAAADAIQAKPFLGYGQSFEREVINLGHPTHHPHAHQQFLSWGIWGGVVAILSGCIFGFAAVLTRKGVGYLTLLSVLLGGSILMTDSLIARSGIIHALVPIMIFGYAIHVANYKPTKCP